MSRDDHLLSSKGRLPARAPKAWPASKTTLYQAKPTVGAPGAICGRTACSRANSGPRSVPSPLSVPKNAMNRTPARCDVNGRPIPPKAASAERSEERRVGKENSDARERNREKHEQ